MRSTALERFATASRVRSLVLTVSPVMTLARAICDVTSWIEAANSSVAAVTLAALIMA